MKQKLLLALLALFTLGGSNLYAQTDVTSTYITNASFESDGSISASNGALTLTGWTQSDPGGSFNNTGCYNASANPPTQGTITVAPSAGDYYLFFRHGWNGNGANYTITSSTSTTLPAGAYTLSIDYKMVEGYDDTQKNTTSVTIAAVSGENTLGSDKGTTKTNVSGGNAYTYLNTADWSTASANFTLEQAIENVQFVITMFAGGQRRSDFVIDNVKLLLTEFVDPTDVSIPSSLSMIVTGKETLTATFAPADANHNTAITWASSDESVATVADGVVTAVAAGTAIITATTANGVSATCEVTVNEAPLANGDYYIMNVATNKYLGGANSWGSQASIIDHGIPFYAELDNGAYKLNSRTYNSDSQHFFTGTYVDGDATSIYITSLGNGKYSISTSNGSAFLTANNENTVVANTATDATSELAQWKFITKDELVAALDNATSSSPVDATFYIGDPNFSRNYWPAGRNVSSWKHTTTNQNLKGGNNDNMCAETYRNNGGKIYQELNVPNGMYVVKCQGFFRQDGGSEESYLYANDEKVALCKFNANNEGTEGSMASASTSFSNGYYKNELTVFVSNGSLTVGIQGQGGNWTCFDNFELYYYGPTIGGEAVKLADPMEAGKWYYFDLDVDGTYNLTANTLSDIVYTNDGAVLIENEGTVTTQFAGAENQQLTAGRYYVKSSSEQTFTIAPASYDYSLGEVVLSTADGGFTQSSTFTVTFPNAVTNDPEGALALVENSKATVNGAEVALTAAENGFTFELGTITAGATYAIVIPAEVFGYANESMNEQISLTINAPAVLDGIYFLRTTDGKYASRGGNYNTRAMVDEFGLPMHLKTNSNGTSEFILVDSYFHLFDAGNGTVYTDNNTNPYWKIQATDGGYTIINVNDNGSKDKFLGIEDNHLQSIDASYVWSIEPASEHTAKVEPLKDAQAATAAEAAGITASTKDELANILSSGYKAIPVTITGVSSIQEEYQVGASNDYAGAGHTVFIETVEGLTPGLYKLTVKGFHRMTWYNDVESASGARSNVYVFAGNAKTQIYSPFDYPATSAWVPNNDYQDANGNYYPNNPTGASAAFNADNYVNEVYVYVDGTSLTFGIFNPNRLGNDGNRGAWIPYRDFTLTRYDENVIIDEADYVDGNAYVPVDKTASVTFKRTLVEGWNGLVLPFDLTVEDAKTKFNATAVKDFESISYDAEKGATLNFTDATEIKAGKPFLIKAAAAGTEYIFDGVLLKSDDLRTITKENGNAKYTMTGTYQKVDLTNVNFVLIQGDKYYQHNTNKASSAKAFRAYFVNESTGDAATKGINFNFDGEATGITFVEDAQNSMNGNTYNLQGQKVNHAQKGVYIVNGKKIVVK